MVDFLQTFGGRLELLIEVKLQNIAFVYPVIRGNSLLNLTLIKEKLEADVEDFVRNVWEE